MIRKVIIDENAKRELIDFPLEIQQEFESFFEIYKEKGKIDFPDSKKISKDLFEIRVRFKGQYRGFYVYFSTDRILVLHFFRKKTQKTPKRNLEIAERRLRLYGRT